MKIQKKVLEEIFDILIGIMEGLKHIKKSTGMDTVDFRYRIVKLMHSLFLYDPERRMELVDIDEDFCNALEFSEMSKNKKREVRETVCDFAALIC